MNSTVEKRSKSKTIVSRWWVDRAGYLFAADLVPTGSYAEFSLDEHRRVISQISSRHEDEEIYAVNEEKLLGWQEKNRTDWIVSRSPVDIFHKVWNGLAYDPTQERQLFREFGELTPSIESLIGFADKWGLLTELPKVVRLEFKGADHAAEEVRFWHGHLFQMQTMLRLTRLLDDHSPQASEELRTIVGAYRGEVYFSDEFRDDIMRRTAKGEWFPDAILECCCQFPIKIPEIPPKLREQIAAVFGPIPDPLYPDLYSETPPRGKTHDPEDRNTYRLFLQKIVNMTLAETTVPVIQIRRGSQIQLRPINLLGAMYLQLALELIGQSPDAMKCHHCGKWFVPEHGRQIYCSTSCNFKAYRKRKNEKKDPK